MKEDTDAEETLYRLLVSEALTRQAIVYRLTQMLPLKLANVLQFLLEKEEEKEESTGLFFPAPNGLASSVEFFELVRQVACDAGLPFPPSDQGLIHELIALVIQPLSPSARQILADYMEVKLYDLSKL